MTFLEVLLLIESRGETITSDKTHTIQTDKFLYERASGGEWLQKELPQTITTGTEFLPIEPYTAEVKSTAKKKKKK